MTTRFAQVKNGTVINVIVADQTFIDGLPKEENVEWVQTDRDTFRNKHLNGGTPLRGNFATIGGLYDKEKDIFTKAKPGSDWVLDSNLEWQPPIPYPANNEDVEYYDLRYEWNEDLYIKSNKTKGWVSPDI